MDSISNKEGYIYDFTVVVCCYNPDIRKLKKTLASIFNQKDVSCEIIISDDGSKNDYYEEIKNWVDSEKRNFPVIYNFLEKNVGTVKNIISALEKAKGYYYKPISPGDYLFNEYSLSEFRKAFEGDKYDIVFSDSVFYSDRGIVKRRRYPYTRLLFNKKHLKKLYCIYGSYFLGATIAAKTATELNILKKVEDKVILLEDFSTMAIAFVENLNVNGVEKPLIWYEYGTGISTKTKTNKRLIDDTDSVYKYILDEYPDNKLAIQMNKKYKFSVKKKIVKLFIGPFMYPGIIGNKILRLFYGPKNYNVNIEQLEKIGGGGHIDTI